VAIHAIIASVARPAGVGLRREARLRDAGNALERLEHGRGGLQWLAADLVASKGARQR
jgi:hypothetical protein